ncbi:glycosyltransferase [Patescibacteria group bacterium]|nr:glycosyltransferase [Patescibacteria group bacterium]
MEKNQPQKIKLAFVLCSLAYGGAERLVLDLIKNLNPRLFEIHLLTVKGGGGLWTEFKKTGINICLYNKKTKLGLLTLWRLKKYFQKNRIQIVHTHLFAGDTWGRLAAKWAGAPIIISTEHNINLDEGPAKKIIKRILSRFTNQIIAVSQAVKNYQTLKEKIPSQKIIVIYNGLDLNRFPFNYRPLRQAATLGIIGRLEPQKGHAPALLAFKEVLKKYPQTKLLIIGQGSLKPKLVKLGQKLHIADSLSWQSPRENVNDFLKQINILLAPSLWEGFGIVAIEALAAGVPVIASQVDGLKEIITDGENGFLAPVNNPGGLAQKIIEVMENSDKLEGVSLKGRKKVINLFTIQQMAERYQKIYLKSYENIANQ